MPAMIFKYALLLAAVDFGFVYGIHDPTYTDTKPKTYHRDPIIAQALHEQQQQAEAYQARNVDANERLSLGYDNNNERRFQEQQRYYRHYVSDKQSQQQSAEDAQTRQQEVPLYQRPVYQSVLAPLREPPAKNRDTENAVGEYYTSCPSQYTGQLPYPYDCRRFLNCWNGRGHLQSCGPATVFNPETLECDRPDKVRCGILSALNGMVQAEPEGAASRLIQRPQTQTPNYRVGRLEAATPHDTPHTATPTLCPPGVSGLQPHPTDCSKFVNCAHGKMHVQQCGPGTAFSARMQVCDFQHKVDCGGRGSGEPNVGSDAHNRDSKSYNNEGNQNAYWNQQIPQPHPPQQQHTHGVPPYPRVPEYPSHSHHPPAPHHQQHHSPDYRDRWTKMDMARPDPNLQQPVNTWSGTGYSVDRQRPTQSVLYVEGSLQPNRNYAPRTYSAPLAPMYPVDDSTTTTQASNIYYAQPVNSQEDYDEMQRHTPTVHSTNNRQDSSRNIDTASRWIPIPNENTSHIPPYYPPIPPNPVNTYYRPNTPHLQPNPPPTSQYPTDIGQQPLPDTDRKTTTINIDNLPSNGAYDLNTYDQEVQPSGVENRFNLPLPSQNPILPTGLLPPYPEVTTTPRSYHQGPEYPTVPRTAHNFPIQNATMQRLPMDPQYSSPYAGVAHSRDTSWPTHSINSPTFAITTTTTTSTVPPDIFENRNSFSLNAPTTKAHDSHLGPATDYRGMMPNSYNHNYYKPPPTVSRPNVESSVDDPTNDLPISDALRMLLRPYLNRSGSMSQSEAEQAESNVMNLLRSTNESLSGTETNTNIGVVPTPPPIMTRNTVPTTPIQMTTYKTTTASTTTTTTISQDEEHDAQVELILAGEQQSLIDIVTPSVNSTSESSNEFHLTNAKPQVPSRKDFKSSGHPRDHEHNREYHLRHPHLPNPFKDEEQSPNKNQWPIHPHHHHHHHNHKHHHNHNHNQHHQHSREFHLKHPHIPNPFAPQTREGDKSIVEKDMIDIPNPNAESTTPQPRFDLRNSETEEKERCEFDCGNGRCIKSFEMCDGVNNCFNRRDELECKHLGYELRLTGGDSPHMGRVEVKILGKWGYVCDDKFDLRDADVVCHELGFKLGATEVRGSSYYPPQDVNFSYAMDEVDCRGNETSLKDCDFKGWGVHNCGPDEVVGVVCKVPQLKCPDHYWLCRTSEECIPTAFVCDNTVDCGDKSDESKLVCESPVEFRLEGGRGVNEGRLEVKYRNEWGTVCDDDFGLKEAEVACHSMGYFGTPKIRKNIFGPGMGPIWLDQVSCFGNESTIDKCNHWTWGESNCNHTEDVGLECTYGPPPTRPLNNARTLLHSVSDDKKREEEQDIQQSMMDDIGLWERSSKYVAERRCGTFKQDLLDEYDHPEERVVNGTIAKRGRYPWQATIRTRGRGGISSHWCGAVLISKKHLLTAAHCLAGYPKGAYFVRMGDHYANIAESSEVDSYIENWYVHEKFRDQTHMNNDIALVVLKQPVRFNDYIQPICLPAKGAQLQENRMCTISGWGSIKSGVSTPSNILRAAELPILDDAKCKQGHVYGTAMTEGMFCAGYMDESVDACDGDSGGPLVCSDNDADTLYGIISWGQHCGYVNKPGVYVRVEKYIDWIYDKINLSMQQARS